LRGQQTTESKRRGYLDLARLLVLNPKKLGVETLSLHRKINWVIQLLRPAVNPALVDRMVER